MTMSMAVVFHGAMMALLGNECPPYTMPPQDDADENLNKTMLLISNSAANVNLCEEFV